VRVFDQIIDIIAIYRHIAAAAAAAAAADDDGLAELSSAASAAHASMRIMHDLWRYWFDWPTRSFVARR